MILLDTHVLVWLAGAREHLSPAAQEAIDGDQDRGVSMASVQELSYLVVRKRLNMNRPLEEWIADALNVHGVRAVAPTISAALRAGSLDPKQFHGDPVDRLIFATAVEHDARLISADERLREFEPGRVVW